jgi:hypothetical protein
MLYQLQISFKTENTIIENKFHVKNRMWYILSISTWKNEGKNTNRQNDLHNISYRIML